MKNAASGRDFQGFKTRLGTDSVDLLDTRDLKIKIPGLNKDITTKDSDGKLKASKGYMWFSLYVFHLTAHLKDGCRYILFTNHL